MAGLTMQSQSGASGWTRRRWLRATPVGAALGTLGLTLGTEAHKGTAGLDRLQEIAAADRSWVQVAVAPDGRRFVNFSRWFGPPPLTNPYITGVVLDVEGGGTIA
jgi:hypothetical protein